MIPHKITLYIAVKFFWLFTFMCVWLGVGFPPLFFQCLWGYLCGCWCLGGARGHVRVCVVLKEVEILLKMSIHISLWRKNITKFYFQLGYLNNKMQLYNNNNIINYQYNIGLINCLYKLFHQFNCYLKWNRKIVRV